MVNFEEIIGKYGTPLYILDMGRVKDNLNMIRKNISYPNFGIHYAMFCNDNEDLLKFLKNEGIGVLALNENEVEKALKLGFLRDKIHITGGTFSEEQLRRLIGYKVDINFDSLNQLEMLGKIKSGLSAGIRVRIYGSDVRGASEGISINDINRAMEIARKYNIKITGIQTYIGTNTLDEQKYIDAAKILIEIARDFSDLKYINIGGGFGISYSSKDRQFSWELFGKEISRLFNDLGKEIELKVEPGRSIAGNAGYFLTKVIETRGGDVIVDAPFTIFPRPFIYHTNHRVFCLRKSSRMKIFRVRGCSINSNDFLSRAEFDGDAALLPEDIGKGDILYFSDVGAYSPVMQMDFLSYNKAKMILI
ncbi:MAG: hypothetical protein PHH00_03850 [Candidatus Nanoarchaeia archaeon]|nr:hypothetical protein [Candidatus Nanoarchaeia archaeon]